jgi:formamidopyrimidine-DNA glycosylase
MPELPEVQTIIDDLNKKIKGDTIAGFWSDWPKAIKGLTLEKFKKNIIGRKILGARRIGKNIFIDLSGGKTLYLHLKMTGHLLVKSSKLKVQSKKDYFSDKVNQYIHHIWKLKAQNSKLKTDFDKTLEFSDVRKFAKIVLDDTQKINELKEVKALGVDALNKGFTLQKFEEILEKRKHVPIGLLLMEQERISGIGNIYRSEILYEAGILPERKTGSLSEKEINSLYKAVKKILKKAVKLRGTSDSDYRDTAGAPGSFQKVLKVYRRGGEKCKKCGTIVKRIALGQRSAFYCPVCQR